MSSFFRPAVALRRCRSAALLSLDHCMRVSVQVMKNRFDGDLGRVPLAFEKDSLTLSGRGLSRQRRRESVTTTLSSDHAPPTLRSKLSTDTLTPVIPGCYSRW